VVGFHGKATQFRIQLAKAGGTTFGGPVGTRAVSAGAEVGVGDTNGDGNPDVYIVTGSTNPDTLLLGNGSGSQWTVSPTPQATSGSGQSVIPFDYNQNGTVDMIVMNGADGTTGPIQLITFDH
jgi:FG-GAP-like repeat